MIPSDVFNPPPASDANDSDFVVADPHVVYYDAVMNSPWTHEGGRLPEHGDWSTYRYAVKDIILGVATHRYNKNNRRLEIRAYFVGEHPIFKELEPTKAMMIVFCCQSYQSGGSLDLFFERGVPFDVRTLIEDRLGLVVSGHTQLLQEELMRPLFAALSDFSPAMQARITAHDVGLEMVCYNAYRGTWSPNHIKGLVQRGISLRWLFKKHLDPLKNPLLYAHLVNHIRAVLLEEYAVRRLEDRPMGESLGKRIVRTDEDRHAFYTSMEQLRVSGEEGNVDVLPGHPFCLIPLIPRSTQALYDRLETDLAAAQRFAPRGHPVVALPMDFIYLPPTLRADYAQRMSQSGVQWLVVGQTVAQLLSEVQLNLSVTASQVDADEVDSVNVDRYPD